MSEDILKELLGKVVEVRSQSERGDPRDDGTLISYDARWICLEKSFGERLYFPITNVRLLKPLG